MGTVGTTGTVRILEIERGRRMAKFHARPSLQYRYEHYDPRLHELWGGL